MSVVSMYIFIFVSFLSCVTTVLRAKTAGNEKNETKKCRKEIVLIDHHISFEIQVQHVQDE